MPVKRVVPKEREELFSDEALDAFEARDWNRLRKALRMDYSSYSPLTEEEVGAYGHPRKRPPPSELVIARTWDTAVALRTALEKAVEERKVSPVFAPGPKAS